MTAPEDDGGDGDGDDAARRLERCLERLAAPGAFAVRCPRCQQASPCRCLRNAHRHVDRTHGRLS